MRKVLSLDPLIAAACDHYYDDIIVDEAIVPASQVVEHLAKYGLKSKPPKPLEGTNVLGLAVSKKGESWCGGGRRSSSLK